MTATISETVAGTELAYRGLIDDQLWQRLAARLVRDENVDRDLAERVVNEALGFLQLCALEPDGEYSPSASVDLGWHTFVLYTREYAAFCDRLAGRFIHHSPTDIPGMDYPAGVSPEEAMRAMRKYGPVDEMLWAVPAAGRDGGCQSSECNQCCHS